MPARSCRVPPWPDRVRPEDAKPIARTPEATPVPRIVAAARERRWDVVEVDRLAAIDVL
jgi:hypothetical protein